MSNMWICLGIIYGWVVEDDTLGGAAIVVDAGWSEWRWLGLLVWRLRYYLEASIVIVFIASLIVVFLNMLTYTINN